MKVRIISGNQAGQIQEMDPVAASVAIATGYAEPVAELAPTPLTESAPDIHTADSTDSVTSNEVEKEEVAEPVAETTDPQN